VAAVRAPGGQQVAHERLQVGASGGLDACTSAAQEHVGLPHRDEVGGDGAPGAVLGMQVPLERADERVAGGLVHDPKG
jgi:hypothetical protein